MAISCRPATHSDIELALAIQPRTRGDALIGTPAALKVWHALVDHPFFQSAVLEASSPIQGHRLIGFAASVFMAKKFAQAEAACPRPDLTSRIIAGIHNGASVLATHKEVAQANAGLGLDVAVLTGCWRDDLLDSATREDLQTQMALGFADRLEGYRILKILNESADEAAKDFAQKSVVYQAVAEFPEAGRILHMMTRESIKLMPASIGNLLFAYRDPVLRLSPADQELLTAALGGATDRELGQMLSMTLSTIKARWRSAFVRISETMPDLVSDCDDGNVRGLQKRHRVLAYLRTHKEELHPYDWRS